LKAFLGFSTLHEQSFTCTYLVGAAHRVTSARLIKHELCWGKAIVLAGVLREA